MRQQRVRVSVGSQIAERRAELGVSQAAIARASGIDQGHLSRIERGSAAASLDALVALAAFLGEDLSVRMFPTMAAALRDHLQAQMIEALVRHARANWHVVLEVPVPEARGVIDLVLEKTEPPVAIACEAHSQLRSLDLVLRRLNEKTLALARLRGDGTITSSVLLLRLTEATQRIVRLHEATFTAAFPGRVGEALVALGGRERWPGATLLWVRLARGKAELLERPPRGIAVGR